MQARAARRARYQQQRQQPHQRRWILRLSITLITMATLLCLAGAASAQVGRKVRAEHMDGRKQRLVQREGEPDEVFSRRIVRRLGLPTSVVFELPATHTNVRGGWALYKLQLAANPEARPSSLTRVRQRGVLRRGITEGVDISSWDPFVVFWQGSFRLFYLTQDVTAGKPGLFWGRSWISVASSQDFVSWNSPKGVTFTGTGAPEPPPHGETRLLSPCVIADDGKLYMYFNMAKNYDRKEGYVQLAVSTDGTVFALLSPPTYSPVGPDVRWLQVEQPEKEQFNAQHLAWRDPHVLHAGGDDYFMYITANLHERPESHQFKLCWPSHIPDKPSTCLWKQFGGAVAVAQSHQGIAGPWTMLPPAAAGLVDTIIPRYYKRRIVRNKLEARAWAPENMLLDWNTTQLGLHSGFWEKERSSVILHGGVYHMFFMCWASMVNPMWLQDYLFKGREDSAPNITDSTVYHLVSDKPQGPFLPSKATPVVPLSGNTGLYGISYLECTPQVCSDLEVRQGERLVIGAYIDDPSTPHGFATLEASGDLRLRWGADGEPFFARLPGRRAGASAANVSHHRPAEI